MSVWIDERPVTRFGARPTRLTGFLTAPRGTPSVAGVPGRVAPLVGALQAPEPRRALLGLRVPLASLSDRPVAIAAIEAAIAGAVRQIRTADRPGVVTRAIAERIDWSEIDGAPGLTIPTLLCTITWLAVDGGSEAWPAAAPVLLGTGRTAVPLGSLPTGGWVLLFNTSSPVTLTYTPANGATPTALTITQVVATGDHLAVDLDTDDVWHVTPTTRTRVSALTGDVPTLDPADALGSTAPTLALSSGSGLLLPLVRHRL